MFRFCFCFFSPKNTISLVTRYLQITWNSAYISISINDGFDLEFVIWVYLLSFGINVEMSLSLSLHVPSIRLSVFSPPHSIVILVYISEPSKLYTLCIYPPCPFSEFLILLMSIDGAFSSSSAGLTSPFTRVLYKTKWRRHNL